MKNRRPVYDAAGQERMRRERIRLIAEVPEIGATDFDEKVIGSEKPVLVIFSADRCIPCRKFLGKPEPAHHNGGPDFIEGRPPNYSYPYQPGYNLWRIRDAHKDKLEIAIVDAMRSPELMERFSVEAVPHMIMFYQGVNYGRPKFDYVEDRIKWVGDMMKFFAAPPARPHVIPKGTVRSLRIAAHS